MSPAAAAAYVEEFRGMGADSLYDLSMLLDEDVEGLRTMKPSHKRRLRKVLRTPILPASEMEREFCKSASKGTFKAVAARLEEAVAKNTEVTTETIRQMEILELLGLATDFCSAGLPKLQADKMLRSLENLRAAKQQARARQAAAAKWDADVDAYAKESKEAEKVVEEVVMGSLLDVSKIMLSHAPNASDMAESKEGMKEVKEAKATSARNIIAAVATSAASWTSA